LVEDLNAIGGEPASAPAQHQHLTGGKLAAGILVASNEKIVIAVAINITRGE
jgi:hypothetical protein